MSFRHFIDHAAIWHVCMYFRGFRGQSCINALFYKRNMILYIFSPAAPDRKCTHINHHAIRRRRTYRICGELQPAVPEKRSPFSKQIQIHPLPSRRSASGGKILTCWNWFAIFIFTQLNFPQGTLSNRVNPLRAKVVGSMRQLNSYS
jgi:hypothetical protein